MLLIFPYVAKAQDASGSYELTLRGLQVGTLTFSHELKDTDYIVEANFKTEGLAGALFETQISAKTSGKGILNRAYIPETTNVEITQRDEKSTMELTFENGLLRSVVTDPRQRSTLAPEKYVGAIDPITAMAYVLRTTPLDRLCQMNAQIFDGLTASQITLNQMSQRPDGRYQCQGVFERKDGFSAEQIEAEGNVFNFIALYRLDRLTGDFTIDRIVGESPYGQYQLKQN